MCDPDSDKLSGWPLSPYFAQDVGIEIAFRDAWWGSHYKSLLEQQYDKTFDDIKHEQPSNL